MARRTADWGLRVALLAALTALVTTALIVHAMPPPTGPLPAAVRGTHGGRTRGHAKTRVHATTPTAPTVPGAVFGEVTRAHAGGGCGFSLGAQAASTPVGSCTVLEIGDSLGNDLGWGLLREVAPSSGLRLVQMDKSASGLANSAYYDWPAHLAVYLQAYHPQLVLISLGGDDEQGMDVQGSAVEFPTTAWQNAYLDRVRQLVGEATASGAYVLWVGLPVMGPTYYSQGIGLLNTIYQTVVTSEPNATFVSTWNLFSNPQGNFQADAVVNGSSASLREPDGIHYSYIGENVVATYVIREMALIYHVQLAPRNPAEITGWQ